MLKQHSCMGIRVCTARAHPLLLYGGGGGGGGGGEGLLLEELLDLQAPQPHHRCIALTLTPLSEVHCA